MLATYTMCAKEKGDELMDSENGEEMVQEICTMPLVEVYLEMDS